MADNFPHITISIAHSSEDSDNSGDLNSLAIGFGVFLAWLFGAVFGTCEIFREGTLLFSVPALSAACQTALFDAFTFSCVACLLLLAFTNQLFLRFYVGKNALVLATGLTVAGTYLVFGSCATALTLLSAAAGVAMGVGTSLMIVLWGTAFSRYEFPTIILNTAIAVVIGIAVFMALGHWVPAPISGALLGILPALAASILWKLTPIPYYRRSEMPIFHPLPVHRAAFALRLGVPSLVFGIVLGALRYVSINGLMSDSDMTPQLIVGVTAIVSIAIVFVIIAVARGDYYWDTIFRCFAPVVVLGTALAPSLNGQLGLGAEFFVILAFILLETLLWLLFSDLAQEFRLSPIFVFGLGAGLMEAGSFLGGYLAQVPVNNTPAAYTSEGALAFTVLLIVAYALFPRQREILAIVDPNHRTKEVGFNKLREQIDRQANDDAAAESAAASASPSAAAVVPAAYAAPAVETAAPAEASDATAGRPQDDESEDRSRAKGRFHARCEEIADMYLLSRRETEVMFLLAKGHNAAFIQDKLCISKSTAKTHINHIYRKLDIHTQQELLNMVEERPGDRLDPAQQNIAAAGYGTTSNLRADIFEPRRK